MKLSLIIFGTLKKWKDQLSGLLKYSLWPNIWSGVLAAFISREVADEDGEEDDEGVHLEQNPSSKSADVDSSLRDEDDREEEEDELAEYGLDKYDEEDTGEECTLFFSYVWASSRSY